MMQMAPEFQPGSEAGAWVSMGVWGSLCREMISGETFLYKYY